MSQPPTSQQEQAKPAVRRGRKPRGESANSAAKNPNETVEQRVYKRIVAATKTIKKLEKKEQSTGPDAYSFVSIDDYYEQIALVIARDFGLSWMLSEEPSMEERFSDVYQDIQIRKVYRTILITDEGDVISYAGFITVSMPYEGATTAGKMLSYAEKAFMRRTFKIPTGEAEAENSKTPERSERSQQSDPKDKDKFFSPSATLTSATRTPGQLGFAPSERLMSDIKGDLKNA